MPGQLSGQLTECSITFKRCTRHRLISGVFSALLCLIALQSQSEAQSLGQSHAGPRIIQTGAELVKRDRPLPPQIAQMPDIQEELDVIENRSQLIVSHANIMRTAIADSNVIEVVQYSPREIAVIGVGLGTTTLTLWFEGEPEPLIYLISTIRDPGLDEQRRIDYGKLERKIQILFPNSKVYLIPLSYKIVVKGQARDAEEAARILEIIEGEVINQLGNLPGPQPNVYAGDFDNFLTGNNDVASSFVVNMLEVPGERQVMLRVRIAQLDRQELRQMGVDINAFFESSRHFVSATMGGTPSTLTGIFENGEVNVLVNWLATNGTAKILSEPTLTVMSGHPASFLSGGEFAVPTIVGLDGAAAQQTTFRGFGTSIIVTPTIIDKDLIRMRVIPEYSSINTNNSVNGIPGLDSRRVQTTVELREGQTIAIAGLIGRRTDTEVTRIPFLGEIPVIGSTIFSAKRAAEDETELLILVTPELVRPMDAEEVPPMPGWYVTHPTDKELYKYAMTEGAPDLGVYQMGPIGRNAAYPREVGYHVFEPAPGSAMYSPSTPYPQGIVAPLQPPGTQMEMVPPAPSTINQMRPPVSTERTIRPPSPAPAPEVIPPTPQPSLPKLPGMTMQVPQRRIQQVSGTQMTRGTVRQAGYQQPLLNAMPHRQVQQAYATQPAMGNEQQVPRQLLPEVVPRTSRQIGTPAPKNAGW
ncbi:type II and III secretion system protein family protein [Calycomorphotria hydatis]|uniref:Type II secretion system protein D n=1 Tax=Calycomorphotria hydatis TaxID=2528027 RepID=A0A517T5T4_9PLAN|nr:pilus assembly protein N-terminal domain-containing protein [Calycomorphotria hydatis]QDT63737.1 Putative type II secretion system protein D precursor [Calycomorphotria hydatis]